MSDKASLEREALQAALERSRTIVLRYLGGLSLFLLVAVIGAVATGFDVLLTREVENQLQYAVADEIQAQLPQAVHEQLEAALQEELRDTLRTAVRASSRVGDIRERLEDVSPPRTLPDARVITIGDAIQAAVNRRGTQRFRLEVEVGGNYTIQAEGIGGFDPFIYVYETEGNTLTLIDVDDDGGDGVDARLQLELDPGDYYVEVEGFAGRAGECEVLVSGP